MAPRKSSVSKRSTIGPGELPVSALRRTCDPASLGFKTTDDLPDLNNVIGQPRAFSSLELGSEISGTGYNIFVLGQSGSGRSTLSREFLERKASAEPTPDDWCYVNNFKDERRPKAIRLPAGKGAEFQQAVRELTSRFATEVPRVFNSEEFGRERDKLVSELKKTQEEEFLQLQQHAEQVNFVIIRTSSGIVLAPGVDGKPLPPDQLEALTSEQKLKIGEVEQRLGEQVQITLNRLRDLEKTAYNQLQELVSRTVQYIIKPLIQPVQKSFKKFPLVVEYLGAIQEDLITNLGLFRSTPPNEENSTTPSPEPRDWRPRYAVNLLVDHSDLKGAPVVMENYPTYNNLIGRIEHEVIMGGSRTDFTMIHAGALHQANGGYLVLPIRDVMLNPYAWEGLKRVLRDGEIRIVELANQVGLLSTTTLEPEPVPLQVKVVLIGSPAIYYSLRAYDEDFSKLFKVRAEFATQMDRTPENEHEYGLFVKSVVMENHLLPFDRTAVARVIEYSSELADDQARLTTRFGKIADLVREAAYWAAKSDARLVTASYVKQAIQAGIYRRNLVEERIQELINQGTLLIDSKGAVVGQVNALSVLTLGDYAFGRPTRVTAITYPGKAGIVDIERQAKLAGALHTKSVLILSGCLSWLFGQEQPLSLSASLTFEQSYEEIDGDSASAAELIALLSSIARLPVRQDRAITGSINQLGIIQAIGGVNEKIEGFFAICLASGLTGDQGVIIPSSNQRHLMLSDEVCQAVKKHQFHVWTIDRLDEAIPLLLGLPAGERQPKGEYPTGTFYQAVNDRLNEFNRAVLASTKNMPKTVEPEPKENKSDPEGGNQNA